MTMSGPICTCGKNPLMLKHPRPCGVHGTSNPTGRDLAWSAHLAARFIKERDLVADFTDWLDTVLPDDSAKAA
jgi:hypothetical protein